MRPAHWFESADVRQTLNKENITARIWRSRRVPACQASERTTFCPALYPEVIEKRPRDEAVSRSYMSEDKTVPTRERQCGVAHIRRTAGRRAAA